MTEFKYMVQLLENGYVDIPDGVEAFMFCSSLQAHLTDKTHLSYDKLTNSILRIYYKA